MRSTFIEKTIGMYLEKLKVINYKNFSEKEISFNTRITCLIGENGVGKTNLLDSIYFLSFCKGNFVNDAVALKQGEDSFYIRGDYVDEQKKMSVVVSYAKDKKKQVKVNEKKYDKFSEHIGEIPLIFITPADMSLINGSGSERRRFLDSFISQFDRKYLHYLVNYNRLLMQRNKMLKILGDSDYDTIEIYDLKLSECASIISNARRQVLSDLIPYLTHFYTSIAGHESIELIYNTQLEEGELKDLLRKNFTKDAILKHTGIGVHRDDVDFILEGMSLKLTGSQGQKKTFLYALKFAQYMLLNKKNSKKPIILLDDMFDKLDKGRVMRIIELLQNEDFGQILITDTDKTPLNVFEEKGETDIQLISL